MDWLDRCVPCKVGTIPMMVRVHGKTPVRPNARIKFQDVENGKWRTGIVSSVSHDGHFFVELM